MDFGVLGLGTITTAVVLGCVKAGEIENEEVFKHLYLCPRSKKNVECIKKATDTEKISECSSNQEVLDRAEMIFVGVHHKSIKEIFETLKFSTSHKICLITAGTMIASVVEYAKVVPKENIFRCLTLPAVKFLKGTTFLFPQNAQLERIFSKLGSIFVSESEEKYTAVGASFCVMGDFYKRLDIVTGHLVKKGIKEEDAQKIVISAYDTMLSDAKERQTEKDIFKELVHEQTPGGMNEQVWKAQDADGSYDSLEKAIGLL